MTFEQLRNAVRQQPFRPFTVSLADGRRLRVKSPEYLWIPPKAQRTFHIAGDAPEDEYIVDLLLVTSIDFAKQNGKPRPRRKRSGS